MSGRLRINDFRSRYNVILLSQKRNLCDWVKYLAALLVVNGHIFLFYNPDSELTPFMNLGACCVSIFFFFSGYGLMSGYLQKGRNYLNGFFKHRILKVLLPLFTAYIITLPIYALLRGPIDWGLVLSTLGWGGPYLKYSWYVTEIVALYVVFYLVMKMRLSVEHKRIILILAVLSIMALLIVSKQPTWYVISLPGFIIGILFQAYETKIYDLLTSNLCLIASILIWFYTWQWHLWKHEFLSAYRWEYISYYVYNVAFVFAIIGVICKMRITPRK